MRRILAALGVFTAFLVLSAPAHAGHGIKSWIENYYLDHPAPAFAPVTPPNPGFQSGGEGATWDLLGSIPTGNPHTDIDFFTQGGQTYASVGTLGSGPNGGGQSIVRLVNADGEVEPEFVAGHPSGTCLSNPAATLSLQHDIEATPKGGTILNEINPSAAMGEAQLLVDATDSRGRCHDELGFGTSTQPRGGLEIIDVTASANDDTNVENPKEIGLTSHAGEAHTVNIDPKRPHIAYAVTSDAVTVTAGVRQNEVPGSGDRFDLDGFEVVDMSSCMNFPAGRSLTEKRQACKPEVYRYRYPTVEMSLGHEVKNAVYGCHELEVYENDRLTCGSGAAAMLFDMSGAFDDNGTPNNYLDDKPNGTALPCTWRAAQSTDPITTDAMVTDCVDGTGAGPEDLNIPNWLAMTDRPSLEGVQWLGSAHHMGRGGTFDSTEDNDFNHETELTESGDFLLATDERGGGVSPPGASCDTADSIRQGNGGIHAFRVDRLDTDGPGTAPEEWEAYARDSDGRKAIYRARVRTGAQATICTAHVFQQIPGQNRIFMGWYSQGTQVVDFTENADGTIDFKEAAYFIPLSANEWVSHVFKCETGADGKITYYGATGDFSVGQGRNTIDVWKVTMPPPAQVTNQATCPAAAGNGNGGGGGNGGNGGGPGGGGNGTDYPLPTGSGKTCMGRRARFVRRGLGRFRLRLRRAVVHRRAGQPGSTRRGRRVYRYCVTRSGGKVILAFDRRNRVRLIASTARGHRRGRIRRGTRASRVARSSRTTKLARNLYASSNRRFVYGTRKGRVRFVAVVDRRVSSRPRALRRYLRLAGLRR